MASRPHLYGTAVARQDYKLQKYSRKAGEKNKPGE